MSLLDALLDELAADPAALARLRELVAPPATDPSTDLLGTADTARELGYRSTRTVLRRIRDGSLKAKRERPMEISRDEIDRYKAGLGGGADAPKSRRPRRRPARDYGFLRE